MNTEALSRTLESRFWPNGPSRDVWMIVDGARDRRVFEFLLSCHLEYSCLYSGPIAPVLEPVAPYLVQLDYGYRDTHLLLRHAWSNQWGIFLRCDTGMKSLQRHLRQFLTVRIPSGDLMLFRYYDPRVMRAYLPSCNSEELQTVFGPIECFWMEDGTPDKLLEFSRQQSHLSLRKFPVGEDSATSAASSP